MSAAGESGTTSTPLSGTAATVKEEPRDWSEWTNEGWTQARSDLLNDQFKLEIAQLKQEIKCEPTDRGDSNRVPKKEKYYFPKKTNANQNSMPKPFKKRKRTRKRLPAAIALALNSDPERQNRPRPSYDIRTLQYKQKYGIKKRKPWSPKKYQNMDRKMYILEIWDLPVTWTEIEVKMLLKDCDASTILKVSMENGKLSKKRLRIQFIDKKSCFAAKEKLADMMVCGEKLKMRCHFIVDDDTSTDTDSDCYEPEAKRKKKQKVWRPHLDVYEKDPSGLYGLKPEFLKSLNIRQPIDQWVHVSSFRCSKAELKEVMDLAGVVLICNMQHNPKAANIMYRHPLEAVQAVSMLNNQMLYGLQLKVTMEFNPPLECQLPYGLNCIGPGLGVYGKPLRDVVRHYERYLKRQENAVDQTAFQPLQEVLFIDDSNTDDGLKPFDESTQDSNIQDSVIDKNDRETPANAMETETQKDEYHAENEDHDMESQDEAITLDKENDTQNMTEILESQDNESGISNGQENGDNSGNVEQLGIEENPGNSNELGTEENPGNSNELGTEENPGNSKESGIEENPGNSKALDSQEPGNSKALDSEEHAVSPKAVDLESPKVDQNTQPGIIYLSDDDQSSESEIIVLTPKAKTSRSKRLNKPNVKKTSSKDIEFSGKSKMHSKPSRSLENLSFDYPVNSENKSLRSKSMEHRSGRMSSMRSRSLATPDGSVLSNFSIVVDSESESKSESESDSDVCLDKRIKIYTNSVASAKRPNSSTSNLSEKDNSFNKSNSAPNVTSSTNQGQIPVFSAQTPKIQSYFTPNFLRSQGLNTAQNMPNRFVGSIPSNVAPIRPNYFNNQPRPINSGPNFNQMMPGPSGLVINPMSSTFRNPNPNMGPTSGTFNVPGPRPVGGPMLGPNSGPVRMSGPNIGPNNMNMHAGISGPMSGPRMGGPVLGGPRMGGPELGGPRMPGPGPIGSGTIMPGPNAGPMRMSGPNLGPTPNMNMQGGPRMPGPEVQVRMPGPSGPNKELASTTVELSNLPLTTTFPLLSSKMAECGHVTSLRVTAPGCAVVQFASQAQAKCCWQLYNNLNIQGNIVRVTFI